LPHRRTWAAAGSASTKQVKGGARAVKSAHEYQRRAEECRQRANHAVHPDDKAGWLQAAQDWNNLALYVGQSAEERGLAAALSAVQGIE
jgi:hypothetical protein